MREELNEGIVEAWQEGRQNVINSMIKYQKYLFSYKNVENIFKEFHNKINQYRCMLRISIY